MIAIVIATYYRPDGKSKEYLTRALNSIERQTYQDYRVYVIGDQYENGHELSHICRKYHKITFTNLKYAAERSKYAYGTYELWCSGGVNAANIGINLALYDGCKYVCHLDHDDWWEPDHLQRISDMLEFNPMVALTVSTHITGFLPNIDLSRKYYEFLPVPCGMITSSACINYAETDIRPRDVLSETGTAYPADADLWQRLANEMERKGRKGVLCAALTCHHDEEGSMLVK